MQVVGGPRTRLASSRVFRNHLRGIWIRVAGQVFVAPVYGAATAGRSAAGYINLKVIHTVHVDGSSSRVVSGWIHQSQGA